MEKRSKAPMIYGYAVCLVAVITFLIAVASVIYAVMDLSDPLYAATNYNKASIASYENYKMDMLKEQGDKENWVPDEVTLKGMYQAEKDDRVRRVRHDSMRNLYIHGTLIIICIVLFITHWRWMRRLNKAVISDNI